MEKLENLNSNPEFYQYMTHEEDERKIHNSMMYEAEQKGIKKGSLETARNFKNLGIDIETISKATGLSKEKIEKL